MSHVAVLNFRCDQDVWKQHHPCSAGLDTFSPHRVGLRRNQGLSKPRYRLWLGRLYHVHEFDSLLLSKGPSYTPFVRCFGRLRRHNSEYDVFDRPFSETKPHTIIIKKESSSSEAPRKFTVSMMHLLYICVDFNIYRAAGKVADGAVRFST